MRVHGATIGTPGQPDNEESTRSWERFSGTARQRKRTRTIGRSNGLFSPCRGSTTSTPPRRGLDDYYRVIKCPPRPCFPGRVFGRPFRRHPQAPEFTIVSRYRRAPAGGSDPFIAVRWSVRRVRYLDGPHRMTAPVHAQPPDSRSIGKSHPPPRLHPPAARVSPPSPGRRLQTRPGYRAPHANEHQAARHAQRQPPLRPRVPERAQHRGFGQHVGDPADLRVGRNPTLCPALPSASVHTSMAAQ